MDLTGLGSIFDFGSKLIDKLIPDPAQKAQATLDLAKLQQTGELAQLASDTDLMKGQIEINKIEASSTKAFIAYARPFILWTCGVAFAYAAIVDPCARFVANVIYHYTGPFPAIDTSLTMQVMLGILGLGGLRTYEKVKNAEGNR